VDTVSNNTPSEYKAVLDENGIGYKAASRWLKLKRRGEMI
jgi:hypothetical protein